MLVHQPLNCICLCRLDFVHNFASRLLHVMVWTGNEVAMPAIPGEQLRDAVEEWQIKRQQGTAPRLTTGFLDGTHPIVDAYELKARFPWLARSHL